MSHIVELADYLRTLTTPTALIIHHLAAGLAANVFDNVSDPVLSWEVRAGGVRFETNQFKCFVPMDSIRFVSVEKGPGKIRLYIGE